MWIVVAHSQAQTNTYSVAFRKSNRPDHVPVCSDTPPRGSSKGSAVVTRHVFRVFCLGFCRLRISSALALKHSGEQHAEHMARQREAHESTRLGDSAAQRAYLLEVAGLRHNEVVAETELAR